MVNCIREDERMDRMYFGTAGIPLSTGKRNTPEGIRRVLELELDAMELEFVRGVRMSEGMGHDAMAMAKKHDILLSAHGPYYINLASEKEDVRKRSVERILNTARTAWKCGGRSITFHGGYYYKGDTEMTFGMVKESLDQVMKILSDETIDIRICPEVMGKSKSFGKLPEIIRLCEEVEGIHPCIDFAHLHALKGGHNTYEDHAYLFEEIEARLGGAELKNLHTHISGIEYGDKGERRHLNLDDSDMNYRDLLKAMKDFGCAGIMICESPNIEEDAIMLKRVYGGI